MIEALGIARCAAWCGVPRNTLYVWLRRGTEIEPIPLVRAMTIFEQARKAGYYFDIRRIAPAVPEGRV